MPKVSIIIPIYNVEKYIKKCLDSLIKQTLDDIEIICVNDGSPDNSMEIVNEYAKNDKRFIVLTQENQGTGAARNKGIDAATGEYIMFLDPDDWYEFDACEKAELAELAVIARKEGHASGLAEREKIGHASGLVEGEKNGILQSAKKFIEKGMSIQEISETLEIPIEKLKEL